jgi:hypothetical protein
MSEQQIFTNIISQIGTITNITNISTICDTAIARLKELRREKSFALSFPRGAKVRMKKEHQHKKPYGNIGTVEKENSVKCNVNFGEHGKWAMPKTMIEIVS